MASSITNYPNGIGSFGAPVFPDPPGSNGGYEKVLFVGGTAAGYQTAAAGTSYANPAPTLLSVFKDGTVDSGDRGTLIVIRKGHTESISAADHFSLIGARKRIKIVGEGVGVERPTFTWTAATATWLLDTDSIILENLNLNFDPGSGSVTVAAPITVSAAGCQIRRCKIRNGTDANSKVTIGVTVSAGGADFGFYGNVVRGAVAATSTTFLRLNGCDSTDIAFNDIRCATSAAAIGVIQGLTVAATNVSIHDNYLENNLATSTACITGMAAMNGSVAYNMCRIYGAGLVVATTTGLLAFYENRIVNALVDSTPESGALAPAALSA